jgi:hypothetical protein
LALCGVTVVGIRLQWLVAVNCTAEPPALVLAGLMLRDSSCRLPAEHPAITIAAPGNKQTKMRRVLFITFPPRP